MDKKKSMNKADISAGRRDITVWAESAGRRLYKNRIFYFILFLKILFLEKYYYFQNKNKYF
jgi:hypothetical protein